MKFVKVNLFIIIVVSVIIGCQSNESKITEDEARLLCDKIEVMHNYADTAIVNEIIDSAYVLYSPLFPTGMRSIEAFKYNIKSNKRSFPDFQLTIDSLFVRDDAVYYFWTKKGTNSAPLGRMPTTGRKIDISGFEIIRVKDGKICEEHSYWNILELYKQLGFQILPPVVQEN